MMTLSTASLLALVSLGAYAQAQTLLGTPTPTATGVAATLVPFSAATPTIQVDGAPIAGPLNATAWSLIYLYPVFVWANFAGNVLRSVGVNEIFHQRALASPDSPGVIKPNIDTLYSRVVLDLSRSDLVLTIPNITNGHYWNYPLYDFFGNDIADLGSVNGNGPGDYLIRRAEDVYAPTGVYNTSLDSPYAAVVNFPTTYGTMLIRFFVASNTTDEVHQLNAYQNASSIRPVRRKQTIGAVPTAPISSYAPNNTLLGIDTPAKLLTLAAKLIPFNQPIAPAERYRVASILGAAGLVAGTYTPPPGLNLTHAAAIANASITADLAQPLHIRPLGHDWEVTIPAYQGNYSTHYAPRAYVAIAGYQQLTTAQTLYPGFRSVGFTSQLSLAPGRAVLLTFSRKPALRPTGFWSFSVYGADQYLVPNPLFRFEVGDRSDNLTYVAGGAVYGPQADARQDGPFQVLLQRVGTAPPANWTGNWLPVSETFSFITRWYVPQEAMTNGSYVYPVVQSIDEITA